jgi:hypothetical protein
VDEVALSNAVLADQDCSWLKRHLQIPKVPEVLDDDLLDPHLVAVFTTR